LAALTLLGLTIWLRRSGKAWGFSAVPCAFMMVMTLWALGVLLRGWVVKLQTGGALLDPVGMASLLLMTLGVVLAVEGFRAMRRLPIPETLRP